jgi:hypothetical protein
MMIAKILIREIFILVSSIYPKLPDNVPLWNRDPTCRDRMLCYVRVY